MDHRSATTQVLADGHHARQWPAIGTIARVVVTDPRALDAACDLVARFVGELDLAASRFRDDSEVSRLAGGDGSWQPVSPLLHEALAVALTAARDTDGDLDPTVGTAMVDLGYDRDHSLLATLPGGAAVRVVRSLPGWQRVELDHDQLRVRMPAGTVLDLGATVKAWSSDLLAARVAAETGSGVLVSLGGDLATAGPVPDDGWTITLQDRPDHQDDPTASVITLPGGGALATSSTSSRTWLQGEVQRHHVLDPRTLLPAAPVWRYVTVAADTCLQANTASTTSLIRGPRAPGWLASLGLPARLVGVDGAVTRIGGWPADVRPSRGDQPA